MRRPLKAVIMHEPMNAAVEEREILEKFERGDLCSAAREQAIGHHRQNERTRRVVTSVNRRMVTRVTMLTDVNR